MLGPVIGGFLVVMLGWQSIFFVNVPIGIIAAALATKFLKIDEILSDRLRMDYPGAALWIVSIDSLVLMFGVLGETGALTPEIIAYIAVLIITFVLFVLRERNRTEPLLDLSVFGYVGLT